MNGISALSTGAYRLSAILNGYGRQIDQSLEKLSTGLKVNRPSDDLNAYFRAQDLERRKNSAGDAADGIEEHLSRVQSAEDAMTTIGDLLDQMEELAKEAADETNSTVRASKGAEYDKLREAIDTVVNTTRFRGALVLDGSLDTEAGGSGLTVQVDEEATDSYTYELLDTQATSATGLALSTDSAESLWGDTDEGQNAATDSIAEINTNDSGRNRLERNQNRIATIGLVLTGSRNSLESRVTNYEAARSALVGVDDAEESSRMTSMQIRQQAAASFLAQNNVSRGSVISFLASSAAR